MSKVIRIGTRDSQLALWQAMTVQSLLKNLGFKTQLIPVKSTGDLVLDKPLYEMGITGIFTKTLDIALLNNEIDIAVHSLKDVPTILPKGIVQAAVLERGNALDILVCKNKEEFWSQHQAIIATGSLRRRAQWLNRYPSHSLVGLRGNVNTRLQKLKENTWNAAIFAAAGLERLGLQPKNTSYLDWMAPAPAQGAVMIAALQNNTEVLEACKKLNHQNTEICTTIERKFLNRLEGGCTAPIGALAKIIDDTIVFRGVLLSEDGSEKIEVNRSVNIDDHTSFALDCADYILEHGGKQLMDSIKKETKTEAAVFSTKLLTQDQIRLFNENLSVNSKDFIKIKLRRIPSHIMSHPLEHVVITSKNTVVSLFQNFSKDQLNFKNIYCVGRRTKCLVEERIGGVTYTAKNAKNLAFYLKDELHKGDTLTYFCSNLRLDDLPQTLTQHHITVNEIVAYDTKFDGIEIEEHINGILFYSPSTVKSYIEKNPANKIAFCIGESTANEARQCFENVKIAQVPTVESVIELVNEYYVQ